MSEAQPPPRQPLPLTLDLDDAPASPSSDGTLFEADAVTPDDSSVVLLSSAEIRHRTNVPGYEILGELGRGGMGVVYKARHLRLNRLTALKMILTGPHAGTQERDRFRREAEAVASLQHPHIVQIFEVGEADGFPFLALEFVDGESLAQLLTGAPWRAKTAAALVERLARAVHHAHERGIVHRDIKPGNVLLAGPTLEPKVSDFGLAKRIVVDSDSDVSAGNTRTGAVMGTPSYIAPEQAAGKNREVGPAADVYALGAVLYELLTGRPPFRGETPLDTVLQVLSDDPAPPRQVHSKVPRDLETITLKCLKKEPRKRYATADALADDLRRYLDGEPITARPVGWWERGVKLAKRRPTVVGMFVTVAAAVMTLLSISVYFNIELRAAAAREAHRANQAALAELRARDQAIEAARQAHLARDAERVAVQQTQTAEAEIQKSIRGLYALQLTQVAALAEADPARALELLANRRRCPPDLRDFAWSYLGRLCDRQKETLTGHEQPVQSIAYSPDGSLIASASWDGTARLWDVKSGRTSAVLAGHRGLVLAVAFSPDGRTLATASDDRTIRLWDVPVVPHNQPPAADQPSIFASRAVLTGHTDAVRCLAFSPEGRWLASGASDGTVRIWQITSERADALGLIAGVGLGSHQPREHWVIRSRKSIIWAVAFSPDGGTLVTGGEDKAVRWYELTGANPTLDRTDTHPDPVIAMAFSPDGGTLATVCNSDDAVVRLWDSASGVERQKLRGHTRTVYSVAFSRSGKYIATGSRDETLRLWDAESGEEKSVLKGHAGSVRCVTFSPDRKSLASASMDATVRVWAVNAQPCETTPMSAGAPLTASTWSRDGGTLVTGGRDGTVRLWRASREGVVELATLVGHDKPILAVAITSDGQTVISSSQDETVRVWKIGKRWPIVPEAPAVINQSSRLNGLMGHVRSLALSPDEGALAAAGDHGLRVWSTTDWVARPGFDALTGRLGAVAFSPDGRTLAAGVGGNLQLWDVSTGTAIVTMMLAHRRHEIIAVTFDRSGDHLATADDGGGVRVWDAPNGPSGKLEPGAFLGGHAEAVSVLAFSPDGRTLATGSHDRTVRLWDPMTGQERATLSGHTDAVVGLTLTAHRDQPLTLVSTDRGGSVKWWAGATER